MLLKINDAKKKYSIKVGILLKISVLLLICDTLVGVTNGEQLPRSNLYIFFRPIFVIKEWPLVEERSKRKASGRHSGRH